MADQKGEGGKLIAENRRARFDYHIEDTLEAGIALTGTEVKSLRGGRANIAESYASPEGREIMLINANIPEYGPANRFNHEPKRPRKLLLHRKQIDTFERKSQEKGLSIIPLKLYFKNGRVKVEVGLGKGRTSYDKRDKIAQTETRKEVERVRAERF